MLAVWKVSKPLQGHWKLLKGGAAIGYNIRGYGAVEFFEAAKQPRSCTKHGRKKFTSGRALVATCHLFAVDKAVTLTQRTHVKMLKGESLNAYNQ